MSNKTQNSNDNSIGAALRSQIASTPYRSEKEKFDRYMLEHDYLTQKKGIPVGPGRTKKKKENESSKNSIPENFRQHIEDKREAKKAK